VKITDQAGDVADRLLRAQHGFEQAVDLVRDQQRVGRRLAVGGDQRPGEGRSQEAQRRLVEGQQRATAFPEGQQPGGILAHALDQRPQQIGRAQGRPQRLRRVERAQQPGQRTNRRRIGPIQQAGQHVARPAAGAGEVRIVLAQALQRQLKVGQQLRLAALRQLPGQDIPRGAQVVQVGGIGLRQGGDLTDDRAADGHGLLRVEQGAVRRSQAVEVGQHLQTVGIGSAGGEVATPEEREEVQHSGLVTLRGEVVADEAGERRVRRGADPALHGVQDEVGAILVGGEAEGRVVRGAGDQERHAVGVVVVGGEGEQRPVLVGQGHRQQGDPGGHAVGVVGDDDPAAGARVIEHGAQQAVQPLAALAGQEGPQPVVVEGDARRLRQGGQLRQTGLVAGVIPHPERAAPVEDGRQRVVEGFRRADQTVGEEVAGPPELVRAVGLGADQQRLVAGGGVVAQADRVRLRRLGIGAGRRTIGDQALQRLLRPAGDARRGGLDLEAGLAGLGAAAGGVVVLADGHRAAPASDRWAARRAVMAGP